MTARTTPQPQGTPTWFEFLCRDADTVRSFWLDFLPYDIPAGSPEYGGYTIAHVGGQYAFGVGPAVVDPTRDVAVTYFAVDDVDTTVARVGDLGGQVLDGPSDITGTGRAAICTDPAGAMFGLWQADPVVGYAAVDEPGFPCWQDCLTSDVKASAEFYGGLFGFTFEPMGENSVLARLGDDGHFTIGPCSASSAPHWVTYLHVADLDKLVEKAVRLGAKVTRPATTLRFGRYAHLTAPGGAPFGLFVGTGSA